MKVVRVGEANQKWNFPPHKIARGLSIPPFLGLTECKEYNTQEGDHSYTDTWAIDPPWK